MKQVMVYLIFQGATIDNLFKANASFFFFYVFISSLAINGVVRIEKTRPQKH